MGIDRNRKRRYFRQGGKSMNNDIEVKIYEYVLVIVVGLGWSFRVYIDEMEYKNIVVG